MFKFFNILMILVSVICAACDKAKEAGNTATVIDLTWENLIPEEFTFSSILEKHNVTLDDVNKMSDDDPRAEKIFDELQALYKKAPVSHKLNGKTVSISGFVVPLERSGNLIEFLLVPYFGACIHVPPPPANQIIHIRSDKGVSMEKMSYYVLVTGVLKTVESNSNLADSGYSMNAHEIIPMEIPDA